MFTDPEKILSRAGILEGMLVGDFGTGGGAYALEAAKRVKDFGRVYAIDIQKDLLRRLSNTLNEQGLNHVDLLHADLERSGGSKMRDELLDFAIASNIFFQVKKKDALLFEIRRVLKPKGKLLFIDWSDSFGHMGPVPDALIDSRDARMLCENGGFSYQKHLGAGTYHYAILFEKKI